MANKKHLVDVTIIRTIRQFRTITVEVEDCSAERACTEAETLVSNQIEGRFDHPSLAGSGIYGTADTLAIHGRVVERRREVPLDGDGWYLTTFLQEIFHGRTRLPPGLIETMEPGRFAGEYTRLVQDQGVRVAYEPGGPNGKMFRMYRHGEPDLKGPAGVEWVRNTSQNP